MKTTARAAILILTTLLAAPAFATGLTLVETPALEERVAMGELPPIAERAPRTPFIVDLEARGRVPGRHGGEMRTLISRARDLRYASVYAYTRLVGYDETLALKPDILEAVEVEDGRIFTFTLRAGHRWSDGAPFTAEDFRYYWEDIANNAELSPAGPPDVFRVQGELPTFEVLDARRVRYAWSRPNPRLLPHLAQPRPNFIYAPAHYLRSFHARYADPAALKELAAKAKLKSWAALHNRLDDPYENANPDMPTLNPWVVRTKAPANRFVFERNPYYHRFDREGRQLPYVDRMIFDIAAGGLVAAKANAGEVDMQARGLSMSDAPVLKEGERAGKGYRTLLWPVARGSTYAFFPNQTVKDPVWRALNRDVRYRRALSLAIDRRIINNALLFGLGVEGGDTVLEGSALFRPEFRTLHATYDPKTANALLDAIGLTARDNLGYRKLPDGRRLEIICEVDGEASDMIDALQLVTEFWRDIGVKLFVKPQERTILRNRVYAGQTVMVAAQGLDNAIPTGEMPPHELAPVRQDHYAWSGWGQYQETAGKAGEAPDTPEALALRDLYRRWNDSADPAGRRAAWERMLAIHADQRFVIGTVAGDLQPIVVAKTLRNVPAKAVFSWEPTALIGVYRIDEWFHDR